MAALILSVLTLSRPTVQNLNQMVNGVGGLIIGTFLSSDQDRSDYYRSLVNGVTYAVTNAPTLFQQWSDASTAPSCAGLSAGACTQATKAAMSSLTNGGLTAVELVDGVTAAADAAGAVGKLANIASDASKVTAAAEEAATEAAAAPKASPAAPGAAPEATPGASTDTEAGSGSGASSQPVTPSNSVQAEAMPPVGATAPPASDTQAGAGDGASGSGQPETPALPGANPTPPVAGAPAPAGSSGGGAQVPSTPPPPPPVLNLGSLQGPLGLTQTMTVTNTAANSTEVGNLGEQVAQNLINNATGGNFQAIQNASNNGADLLGGVDPVTKTIDGIEVKSSTVGSFPSLNGATVAQQFVDWINNAASGFISGQEVDAATEAYAQQLQDLIKNKGYTINPVLAKVNLPPAGTTGASTVIVVPLK